MSTKSSLVAWFSITKVGVFITAASLKTKPKVSVIEGKSKISERKNKPPKISLSETFPIKSQLFSIFKDLAFFL